MSDAGLQGRLADFTLEEILQLIALQQKTGLLTVDASYPMFLAFDTGMLVAYRDRRRAGADPLEEFLKRYGFFEVSAWENVEFVQKNSKLDLTEILVNEKLLTAEELEKVQYDAAQEDIFRGMQLRDGRYHFLPGPGPLTALRGRVRFKVDGLLMEAVRRIDEIGGLREVYFSNDITIARTDQPLELAERSNPERVLLNLLGRENALGVLVANGRMAEFDTLSTLEQMREDGIIEVQSKSRPVPQVDQSAARRAGRKSRFSRRALVVSALATAAAVALIVLQPFAPYRDVGLEDSAGLRFQAERDRARLIAAIELYSIQRERPPASLDDLKHDQWIDEATVLRCEDLYDYRVQGRRWSLEAREDS